MAIMTEHAWSRVRRRLLEMIHEDKSMASPGNQKAQIKAFEDPTIQKWLRPFMSKRGEDEAFDAFCNYFDNIIRVFIEAGLIYEDELVPANPGMAG